MKQLRSYSAGLFAMLLMLQACGSGGGSSGVVPQAQKTATLSFETAIKDQSVTVQLRGISIAVALPEGVTVATSPGTNEITSAVLKGKNQVATGTYVSATRTVTIVNMPNGADLPIGQFASLVCDIVPGKTFTDSQFTSIVPTDFQPTGPGGADLTQSVASRITVSFGH